MSTRSRTGLFLSFRDSTPRDDELSRLIAIDVALPPHWADVSDHVLSLLADTATHIHALDKLHAKHVLPGFSDRSQEQRDIDALTTRITKDFRACHTLIQRIPHAFPPAPQETPAKNVQRALAAKVQHLSAVFRKKQRIYMDTLQGHATKNQDLLFPSALKASDLDDDIHAASHVQQQQLLQHPSSLQARDRELQDIAKSIASLAELFKDLSVLVIDQGTLLDSVEFNIEQTAVHMEDAVTELTVATRYQKNTGRRKCIFLLLLIIVGLIVVLILKPKRPPLHVHV